MDPGNRNVIAASAIVALVVWILAQRKGPSTTRLPWQRQSGPRKIGGRYANRSWPWLLVPILLLAMAAIDSGDQKDQLPDQLPEPLTTHRLVPSVDGLLASMPVPGSGNTIVRPVFLRVWRGGGARKLELERELKAVSDWFARNHNPKSLIQVRDLPRGTRSGVYRASDPTQRALGKKSILAIRERSPHMRELSVSLGGSSPPKYPLFHIDLAPGSPMPKLSGPVGPRGDLTVSLDPLVRNAIAATVARAVMSVSQMSETSRSKNQPLKGRRDG